MREIGMLPPRKAPMMFVSREYRTELRVEEGVDEVV